MKNFKNVVFFANRKTRPSKKHMRACFVGREEWLDSGSIDKSWFSMRSLIACPVVDCIGIQLPVTKVLFTFLCTVPTVSQAFVSPFSLGNNNIQKEHKSTRRLSFFTISRSLCHPTTKLPSRHLRPSSKLLPTFMAYTMAIFQERGRVLQYFQ